MPPPPNLQTPQFPESDPESLNRPGQMESTANLMNRSDENYKLRIFNSSLNLLTHILIGAVVGVSLFFAFRAGLPLGATPLHIVLCVVGYQLLMAQAILSLSPYNGWSANLKFIDKRRAHWILQILGSGLAIAGSFIKILDKSVHWNTLHGQFALVALVLTSVCFVNGLTSNYAYELRKFIPANLSKLTHICFGTVAFAASSMSLVYGFDKNSFRNWLAPGLAPTIIAFTSTYTIIIIINPLIVFATKSMSMFKR